MTTPFEAMEALDSRLWDIYGTGVNPWASGAGLIAGRLGMDAGLALEGVVSLQAGFARVMQAEDPRRFRIAAERERAAAIPALILGDFPDDDSRDDLLALSLKDASRRFWRMTCMCDWLGDLRPDKGGTLRLRQDAHAYVGGLLKAAAYERRGRTARREAIEDGFAVARARSGVERFVDAKALPVDDPGRVAYLAGFQAALRAGEAAEERWRIVAIPPPGALVLDPLAIDWTRRGVLAEVEWIEIVDAPADGPLGRALKRANPRIGTSHGVRLDGLEVDQPKYQRRAA